MSARDSKLNLIILTSYYAIETKDIRGGIGYRFVTLYGLLVKSLLNYSSVSKVFWYSHQDKSIRFITLDRIIRKRSSMLKSVLKAFSATLKDKSKLIVLISYPYAVPNFRNILDYCFTLVFLRVFGIHRLKVVVDDFDHFIENSDNSKLSVLGVIYKLLINFFSLKSASFIITISESFKQYVSKLYRVNKKKILVVPCGSQVKYLDNTPPKSEWSFDYIIRRLFKKG